MIEVILLCIRLICEIIPLAIICYVFFGSIRIG